MTNDPTVHETPSDRDEVIEQPPRRSVVELVVRRPVAVIMVALLIAVFGYVSYNRLSLTLMPDIAYPTITVRTEYPGAAPEEVETVVSRPMEQELGVVNHLVSISSVSRAELSDVLLEFAWGTDMSEAAQDIREQLERVQLPDEVERPLILRYDPSLDPIMRLALSGDRDLFTLRRLAEDEVQRSLETLDGVAAVRVRGGLEQEILVEVSEEKLSLLGMSISQIVNRLAQENVNLSGGELREGLTEYMVRTLNEFQDLDEIRNLVISDRGDVPIRLSDIATVTSTNKEREVITRIGGTESVEIEIYKEGDANIVEVAARVRDRLLGTASQQEYVTAMNTALQDTAAAVRAKYRTPRKAMLDFVEYRLPADVQLNILSDQSQFIEASISEVKSTAVIGGILAVIVLFLFLRNLQNTVIIAVAIPLSIIATFAGMYLGGVSLNIMSLGGLALGIGMLVDNSIVVLESIFRCREEGDDIIPAAIRGTSEVAGAVTASTLTTIAVFLPIVFVEGVAGQVFGDLSLAVVFSLLASLVVAVWFIPMLASRTFGGSESGGADASFLGRIKALLGGFQSFAKVKGSLANAWARRKTSSLLKRIAMFAVIPLLMALAVAMFVIHFALEAAGKLSLIVMLVVVGVIVFAAKLVWIPIGAVLNFLGKLLDLFYGRLREDYPKILDAALDNRMSVIVLAAALFGIAAFVLLPRLGSELIPQVHQGEFFVNVEMPVGTPIEATDRVIRRVEEMAKRIDGVKLVSGRVGAEKTAASSSDEGENTGRVSVVLSTKTDLEDEENRVMEELRTQLNQLSNVETRMSLPVLFSFKTPVEVEIHGYDLNRLRVFSEDVRDRLAAIPGFKDVETNLQPGNPEVRISYDRQRLAELGLTPYAVATLIRTKVRGDVATQFRDENMMAGEERRVDIRVQVMEEDKAFISNLHRMVVNPGQSVPVQLGAVANIDIIEGPSEIRRIGQQRAAIVSANLDGIDLGTATRLIDAQLHDVSWPADMNYFVGGQNAEMQTSLNSLYFALALAVFLVYVVMASQFESFLHPFVILFSIPLALIGVVFVLWAMRMPLSVVVFLGIIVLAGIVVNNAIVLVDYVNQLRRGGMGKREALKQAGQVRLRPILMTTLTTVLGLTPMALGLGEGAEIRTPMAITVIAGLVSSTLLTLIVIPTVYSLFDRKD